MADGTFQGCVFFLDPNARLSDLYSPSFSPSCPVVGALHLVVLRMLHILF